MGPAGYRVVMRDTPWNPGQHAALPQVADAVRAWIPAAVDSPLYTLFARRIAEDPEMLALVARVDRTPPLNVLFAGVQLLATRDDAVAAWYPRLGGRRAASDGDPYAAFRAFALERRDQLLDIAATRTTQTNEVGRCAVIMPAIAAEIEARGWDPGGAVHAVDVGAAAGLTLLMDRISYDYGGVRLGSGAPLVRGERRGGPPLPRAVPTIATRTGIDLAPVDLERADAVAWLEALVWPEHGDRVERLRAAVARRRETPVSMVAGDAAAVLAPTLAALPPGPVVVWHTVALYQAPAAVREAIDDAVEEAAASRPLLRVGMEPGESGLTTVRVGPRFSSARAVAVAHPHGAWYDGV